MPEKIDIGIIGGSGLYELLDDAKEVSVSTPYGAPSDKIAIGNVGNKSVGFIPRHGKDHQYPPHLVNYRANLYALKKLGAMQIISTTAVGSLQADIAPGDFVITDQFIDRTKDRKDTFYEGPDVRHASSAYPYCPRLRKLAIDTVNDMDINFHESGTVVVIQGPRFSSKAESKWFSSIGGDTVSMTQYPEVILARELGLCYVNISLVTDYDAGLEGRDDIKPVTNEMVQQVFKENIGKVKKLILKMVKDIEVDFSCTCKNPF